MLETYLFVDPLCSDCFRAEHVILKLAKHFQKDFSFQFIPMLNMQIVKNHCVNKNRRIINESKYFKIDYHAILDYKAALFQGRKCGRNFLIGLQNQIIYQKHIYSNQVAINVAKKAGLDLEMFEEDRRSELAINAFKADQKLANEMQIKTPASAVIFNCDSFNSGILMNNVNYYDLLTVCSDEGLINPELIKNHQINNFHTI